jgi:hypothetical protein
MKIVRSPVRSVVSNVVRSVVSTIRRYFLDFNGTDSYAELETAFTPAGDFSVEVDFSIGSIPAGQEILIDSDADLKLKIGVNASNGAVAALVGDGSSWVFNSDSGISVCDGKLHRVKLSKIGSSYKLYLDNEIVASATSATAITPSVNVVGRQAGGSKYFGGVIANVKLTDLDTPANSETYRLDRPTANYELPVNNVTGSEQVTNGDFSDGNTDDWFTFQSSSLSVVNGAMRVTNSDALSGRAVIPLGNLSGVYVLSMLDLGGTAAGTTYGYITTTSSGSTGGSISVSDYYTSPVSVDIASGTYYLVVGNGSNTLGEYTDFDSISIKQVTNALVYRNIPEADRFQAQLVGFDWVGTTERVVNGDFSDGLTSWSASSGDGVISVVDGVANVEKNTTVYPNIGQTIAVTSGSVLLATADFTNPTSSEVYLGYSGSPSPTKSNDTSGSFSLILAAPSATPRIESGFWAGSGGSGEVMTADNISVKRILEAP